MKLSILTATFNRAELLKKLYKSIVENIRTLEEEKFEVEWIIIDDGSNDNTKEVICNFKNKDLLTIKYIYQNNFGKMQAINNGMKYVTGNLVMDCDSDDYFEKDAFNIISKNAYILLENQDIYALCFLKSNEIGEISGNKFMQNYKKTKMFDLYFKEGGEGEKILVFNSEIRKKFKHKLEEGEKFITESRMYHKMDEFYDIICINEVIQIGDYLKEGYTKNISRVFKENPKGFFEYFKEILKKDLRKVSFRKKIYIVKQWWVFLFFKSTKKYQKVPKSTKNIQ